MIKNLIFYNKTDKRFNIFNSFQKYVKVVSLSFVSSQRLF